jgi:hypothetical protein
MNDLRERALKMLGICLGADMLKSGLETLLEAIAAISEQDFTGEQACDAMASFVARMLKVNHTGWHDGIKKIDPALVIPGGREPWKSQGDDSLQFSPEWNYRGMLESAIMNEIWGES